MNATLERIPSHLRQYVVKQDYSAYDEIDQAVWRYVMRQKCYTTVTHPASLLRPSD